MELCPKSKSGFPHSIQVDETPRTKEQKKKYILYMYRTYLPVHFVLLQVKNLRFFVTYPKGPFSLYIMFVFLLILDNCFAL